MIVGTAGHIDHGKTTLVRALTGVDTDRLKEEKARGISIELGYAYTPLNNGEVLGFVDVPGHERLVHTMVAGACGIDFALLVVAADDGVMPQTREHLAILDLLGVKRGAVALTKIDRVDPARVREVEAQVAALLAPAPLRGAPQFQVNATAAGHPGTEALRQYLHDVAVVGVGSTTAAGDLHAGGAAGIGSKAAAGDTHSGHAVAADSGQNTAAREGLFRLAVDRVFTLPGLGTMVTGTVFSGQVAVGDTVSVMPSKLSARVRSIHAQNRASERGRAGERCALNLVGVDKGAISRGDWVADPRALAPSSRVDVSLRLLGDGSRRLDPWAPLHFHAGTVHRVAHVVLLESQPLTGGDSGRVQLVFDAPICALAGDRFIVRDAQAMHTIGGGVVLDPFGPSRKRRSAERMQYLTALERMIAGEGIRPLLDCAPHGLSINNLVHLTGRAAEHLALPPEALVVEAAHDRFVILPPHWRSLRERAVTGLLAFHSESPDEPGPDIGRLRRIAAPDLPDTLWRSLIDELVREGAVIRGGAWLHLPEHAVTLSDADQALAVKLQPLIAAGAFDPPWVRDLAKVVREPEDRVRQLLRKQVTRGAVYQVVRDLFYDAARIGELARILADLINEHGRITAAEYRDAIGLGRKRTIQILEFFDRIGYTRRVHDCHVLRRDSGWRVTPGEPRRAHAPGGAAGLQTQEGASDASW